MSDFEVIKLDSDSECQCKGRGFFHMQGDRVACEPCTRKRTAALAARVDQLERIVEGLVKSRPVRSAAVAQATPGDWFDDDLDLSNRAS